jgi:hypothetical protein
MASWKTDLNLDPQASSGSLPANTHCGHPADGGEGVFDNACVLPNVTTILDIWLWDIGGCHECGHIDPCLPSPAKKRDVSVFPDTDAARFLPRQAEDGPHLPGNGCTSENNSTVRLSLHSCSASHSQDFPSLLYVVSLCGSNMHQMLVDVAKLGIQRIATDCILDSNHGSVCDAPCFVTFGGHCDRQHLDDPNSCNLNGQRLERVCVDNGCIGDPDRVFRRT